jgi:lipoprotein-releasing system ATP-binding protein
MNERNVVLEARGLWKNFSNGNHKLTVLKGINFKIYAGEMVAIVGVSGAGKSTLLHILGTLDQPSEGMIFLNSQNIFLLNELERAQLRNTKIGFIFQFHYLLPEFTALENVMMPLLIQKRSWRESRPLAETLLNEVELEARMHHKPGELSGGELQRVAIARALINQPEIILGDEPTGNLDTETAELTQNLMRKLSRDHCLTLILATHNENLARKSDRRIRLNDGKAIEN